MSEGDRKRDSSAAGAAPFERGQPSASASPVERGSVAHSILALVSALLDTGKSPSEVRDGLLRVVAEIAPEGTANRITDQRNDLLRSLTDAEAMLRTAASRLTNIHTLLARDLYEAANYARASIGRAKS